MTMTRETARKVLAPPELLIPDSGPHQAVELHPSTGPEAIAEDQRRAVGVACRQLGPAATPEQVSDEVILPVCVVRRRMVELALLEPPRPVRLRRFTSPSRVIGVLRGGPKSVRQVAEATGLGDSTVRMSLERGLGTLFNVRRVSSTSRRLGRATLIWSLKERRCPA